MLNRNQTNSRLIKSGLRLAAIGLIFGLGSSCTTLSKLNPIGANKEEQHMFYAGEGDKKRIVVQQPDSEVPVVSEFSQDRWISIRSSVNDPQKKMISTLASGEAKEAINLARRYLEKRPGDSTALTVLTAALVTDKQFALAGYYAGQLLKKNPSDADALNVKGLSVMMANRNRVRDFESAVSYFKRSLDASANQVAAGLNLGHLYLELGNAKAAYDTFADTKSRCDACLPAHSGYGIAASRLGKFEEARNSFETVLAKDQNNASARYHLAMVFRNGFKDSAKSEKHLNYIIANASTKDRLIKDKAMAAFKDVKIDQNDRAYVAKNKEKNVERAKDEPKDDRDDLLPAGFEAE